MAEVHAVFNVNIDMYLEIGDDALMAYTAMA